MENPVQPVGYDDEIDLWQLWDTIWSGRWLIVAITSLFAVGGVTYALVAQEWYRAEVVLAPADKKGGMSGALSQLSGLASLAGVSVGGGEGSQPLAVLKSKDFAREFITDTNITHELLGGTTRGKQQPDMRDAVTAFEGIRSVLEDKKTGLVTISVRWKNADTAALWANELARRVNARLRAEALQEAEINVAYLQKEMAATSVVSLQQSMGRVLEGEMQKLMLARGNEQFAFKVIDPAMPPKFRESPKRAQISILAALVGGFFGVVLVFGRQALRNRPPRPAR
jgi:uncharacterized protein involved in exopolysaccharide biosynthesis